MYSRIWFMFNNALGSLTYAMAMSRSHSNLWALGARASMISHSCCRFYLQLHAVELLQPDTVWQATRQVPAKEAWYSSPGQVLLEDFSLNLSKLFQTCTAVFLPSFLSSLISGVRHAFECDGYCSLPSSLHRHLT